MSLIHSVVCGTGTPKDRDEERDVIGVSSIFKLTHRTVVLTKLLPIFVLSCPRKDTHLKWKVPRFDCAG